MILFKYVIFVVIEILLISATPQNDRYLSIRDDELIFEAFSDKQVEWTNFKEVNSKTYDETEEIHRKSTFLDNLKKIEFHNYLYGKGHKSFKLKVNQFADLEHSEFVSLMNGYRFNRSFSYERSTFMEPMISYTLPSSIDWRNDGYVTEVKNQGSCGSCWAFSTTGALEGQHMRQSGKLVSLSEQNLVDCSSKWGNDGCGGGLMDNAFQYIKENGGLDTEETYPYRGFQGKCHFNKSNIGAEDVGFVDIRQGSEESLKQAVALVGPIAVGIDASHFSFQFYSTGVYVEKGCSSDELDHGVLAVGYGTDEKSQDYWIVKNSWASSWGEDGYIRMARNKENMCGIATSASFPLV